MKKLLAILVILATIIFAGMAQASTITLDGSAASLVGAIGTSSQYQVGSGSWQANGSSKTSIYMTPEQLFGTGISVQVKDIASFDWSTFKSTTGGSVPDWYVTIYTTKDGVNDDGSWYGRRLTFEGLYAYNFSNPADTWNTYQTDSGTNQVTMYDGNRGGNYGFYNGPTLADVTSGAINWGSYANSGTNSIVDYSNEYVSQIVIETGSGWANGFTGYLDNFNITLTSGASAQVDFESNSSVPEPMSIILGIMGLGSIAGFKKFRK